MHNLGKEGHHGTYVYHMPEFVCPKYKSHLFIIYIFKWSVWATRKIQSIKSLEKELKYRFDIPGHDKSLNLQWEGKVLIVKIPIVG